MAYVTLPAAANATRVFGMDDIGGSLFSRVKVSFGEEGAITDASAANPLPILANTFATTTRWRAIGQVNGVAYGQQPRRTGNWQFQHAVRNVGNVAQSTSQGSTFSPSAWYGEVPWRNGAIQQDAATYWKTRTGGSGFTLTQWGDYRPQVVAQGDANNSPLLSRVPSGEATMPFDIYGRTRLNDGTGSAGAVEREP